MRENTIHDDALAAVYTSSRVIRVTTYLYISTVFSQTSVRGAVFRKYLKHIYIYVLYRYCTDSRDTMRFETKNSRDMCIPDAPIYIYIYASRIRRLVQKERTLRGNNRRRDRRLEYLHTHMVQYTAGRGTYNWRNSQLFFTHCDGATRKRVR